MPLASEHVLLQTRRKVTVMAFNHANACAHLYGQCVDVHPIVQQCKRGIGVPQTIQGSVLTRARTRNQPCFCDESAEGLMQVL